jgi:sugar lactone lactonase YvrE
MIARRSLSTRRRAAGLSFSTRLEMLETRTLLSAVTAYQEGDLFNAAASAVDGNGNLWVADAAGDLVKITKNTDGSLSDTVVGAPTTPTSIVYDPVNRDIYVANPDSHEQSGVQQYDLSGNLLATFSPGDPSNTETQPQVLTVASDGSVWFGTEGAFTDTSLSTYAAAIGRIDLSGNITLAQLPILNARPESIAAAPDGSVWVGVQAVGTSTTVGNSYLVQATSNSNGSLNVTPYTVPQNTGLITSVAVAADNSVWYSLINNSNVNTTPVIPDSINHATLSGGALSVKSFAIPETAAEVANGSTNPNFLAFDSSGQLWFADNDAVDTLDPATGDITRMASNSDVFPDALSISATDVWIEYPEGTNFNIGDVDLTSFSDPIAATSPDITATAGQPFSGPVVVFASSDTGNFNYTITYGDGNSQSSTIASNSSGIYTIDGTNTYANVGTYNTNVTITSDSGDTASVNGTADVTAVTTTVPFTSSGINLTAQRGQAIAPNVSGVPNVVVAQFSGPADTYTATIHWGDSSSTVGQIVSFAPNQYYVEIPTGQSKSYATEGTFNISVVITDQTSAATSTATSTATISAVPVVASQNLVLQPLIAGIVLNTVANFTADTSSTASWFRATINWGDGTTSVGLVVRTSAGHYTVIGLHLYAKKGTYTVDTSILDSVDKENALATASIKIK